MTEISKRDQIAKLSNELRDEERRAAAEFVQYMADGDGADFVRSIKAFREDSVPSEAFDSQLGNVLTILQHTIDTARDRARPAPTQEYPIPASPVADIRL